jgi:hypothetical protein
VLAAGCSSDGAGSSGGPAGSGGRSAGSDGAGSGGRPNGIEAQSVDRILARVDKALDAASVHTVQVSGGDRVSDVRALHGGDDCTGLLSDGRGFSWRFTTLGGRTWITPRRSSAQLADRSGAPVKPGRYLPVATDSPGFAGQPAQHTVAACHLRFFPLKQLHGHQGGRDPGRRAAGPGHEGQAGRPGEHHVHRHHR